MDLEDNSAEKENNNRVTHDMRDYFYKVTAALIISMKKSAFNNDLFSKRTGLDELFSFVQSQFSEEEISTVENLMVRARALEYDLNRKDMNVRGRIYDTIRYQKLKELEEVIRIAERTLYSYMDKHNMLLPKSGSDGSWDSIEELERRMGIG